MASKPTGWHPVADAPTSEDVLLQGSTGGMVVAYRDVYGRWTPANVECNYDEAAVIMTIGTPVQFQYLPC